MMKVYVEEFLDAHKLHVLKIGKKTINAILVMRTVGQAVKIVIPIPLVINVVHKQQIEPFKSLKPFLHTLQGHS